jgi:predicted P-loop ATPase
MLAQGHRPDISAAQAFELHIIQARSKAPDFDDRKAWHRFNGADDHAPTPGTPLDKLQARLAFHTRTARPLLPPAGHRQQEAGAPERAPAPGPFSPQQANTAATEAAAPPLAPAFAKPNKLEAGELLAMLRTQAQGGRIRYNTFSQLIEVDGAQLEGSERFYLKLAEQGYKVTKELAVDCLVQVARENPYDPVRLYLEHVECSVAPAYIGGLATAYLRPEDGAQGSAPSLYDHMLRCTLIGAVRRVFEPGCKHDTACVLLGDQGARKSSFWAALGGAFFSDALGDISSKDDLMVLHRSWLMEWAELDHIMGRKHAGQIKSFLSQSTDLFRVPYGKATEAFPRRGIIVGSTNRSTGFLQDDTGNRRFWVIPVTRTESNPIDTPTLLTERDAIWAAAVAAYRAGEPNYLPPELAQQVNHENEGYLVENPWTPAVIQWLEARMFGEHITTERILVEAVEKPIERQTRADQMAVAEILRTLGYQRNRAMVAGQRAWRWSKTD